MEKKIISITEEMENLNETIKILEKQKLNAKKENMKLKIEILNLQEELKTLKNNNKHNARNAGRKKEITQDEIIKINELRSQGKTYQAIQKELGISYGNVYKYSEI